MKHVYLQIQFEISNVSNTAHFYAKQFKQARELLVNVFLRSMKTLQGLNQIANFECVLIKKILHLKQFHSMETKFGPCSTQIQPEFLTSRLYSRGVFSRFPRHCGE